MIARGALVWRAMLSLLCFVFGFAEAKSLLPGDGHQSGCTLTGEWRGVDGSTDGFTVTQDASGGVELFTIYPDPQPQNPKGYVGWSSAYGTLADSTLTIKLDYSLVAPTMTGTVDSACSKITWSDHTSWTRMQSISKVHLV